MAWWGTTFKDDRVAKAIADRFPDRAVAIWKKAAESEIAHTKPSAYANAGEYLRKIRRVLESNDSAQEFTAYLKSLKQTHIRKRRLMDILDGLSGQRIVGRK
jgi:uncharacterized Zn finger protein